MTLTRVLQCSGGDKSPSGIGSRENGRKRIEEGEHTDPLFRNLWHQEESEKLLVLVFQMREIAVFLIMRVLEYFSIFFCNDPPDL